MSSKEIEKVVETVEVPSELQEPNRRAQFNRRSLKAKGKAVVYVFITYSNSRGISLDELFKKTVTQPCLYWLPLTEDEVTTRDKAREERRKAREERRKQRYLQNFNHSLNLASDDKSRSERRRSNSRSRAPRRSRSRRRSVSRNRKSVSRKRSASR